MKQVTFFLIAVLFSFAGTAQITLNSDIVTVSQRSVDGKQYKLSGGKHAPYANAGEFLSTVTSTRRHVGEIAYIYDGPNIVEFHFVGGIADSNFVQYQDTVGIVKPVSFTATSQSTFTVTFSARATSSYKVSAQPTSLIAAALFYVTNKTTTSFDIVYASPLTGTVSFDIILIE